MWFNVSGNGVDVSSKHEVWSDIGLMLDERCSRWTNIKPILDKEPLVCWDNRQTNIAYGELQDAIFS